MPPRTLPREAFRESRLAPSLIARNMVSSPAIVPATSSKEAESIKDATILACPGLVLRIAICPANSTLVTILDMSGTMDLEDLSGTAPGRL